jgi:hypothetical protein
MGLAIQRNPMRQILLASTCLFCLASPALAETKIETKAVQPVRTSTVKAGVADDVLITTTGSVVTALPTAVLVDSNNKLTNQGTVQVTNVSNAIGIDAVAGASGSITNNGKVNVDETYVPTDADNDGDLDGPFAVGNNRVGLRTQGAFTGSITNGGSILVEGNDSAGIQLGGTLTGNLGNDGTVSVTGDRVIGIGIANVSGNVRLAGSVNATGVAAIGARVAGDVGGALVVQGGIVASGYRYTSAPADPAKLDADDLLQGGPALSIEGNVAKGILLAVPPKDLSTTDSDEDKDGIDDAKEGAASVVSYGSAAAMRIGAADHDLIIGSVEGTGTGFGLIVDGGVLGDALYKGADANGLVISGLGGGVSISKGIGISGSVRASSVDKAATAIRLGAGATTAELRNSGIISAASGSSAASASVAIAIDAGATLPVIRNSGTIGASVAGADGSATAVIDRSGTVTLIENSGAIGAKGAGALSGRNVAIDLSANLSGATVRQTAVAAGIAAPSITGDVRFGSGNDLFEVADGNVRGGTQFGAGDNQLKLSGDSDVQGAVTFGGGNDKVTLGGTSVLTGAIDFGGGSDMLTVASGSTFTGALANASGLAINVSGGTFGIVRAASVASLNVDNKGSLKVLLDKTTGASSSLNVAGTAQFSSDASLSLTVNNIAEAEGHYVVVKAGSLVGADKLTATTNLLPFLYSGKLSVVGNELAVDVARKSTGELGLNRSESAAFGSIYTALAKDAKVGSAFINTRDQQSFVGTLRQMLPEHAGGTFEEVTLGDRTLARILNDPTAPFNEDGRLSYWVNQVAWGSSKSLGDTAGFKIGGWGVSGGADVRTPVGRFGGTLAFLSGKDNDQATTNSVFADQYSVAAHWRLNAGNFHASARGSYAALNFDGTRAFSSSAGPEAIERTMESEWKGSLVSGTASLAHEGWAGNVSFRPAVTLEYYRLSEDAHSETGGGAALDLAVAERKSDELALNATAAVGLELGGVDPEESYFRLEIEGGRRQILSGALGATSAHFAGGTDFVLIPEKRESGWLGRVRGIGGNSAFSVAGELGGEQREGRIAISARASLKIGL